MGEFEQLTEETRQDLLRILRATAGKNKVTLMVRYERGKLRQIHESRVKLLYRVAKPE
jgi:ribosome recycling factor